MQKLLLELALDFLSSNLPDGKALAIGGPPMLAWAFGCLFFAGWMKKHAGLKTGYTRKIFHFLIFGTVVGVHALWGTRGVCLFGGMVSLVIAYAILRGPGNILYEAMAREKDAPRRAYFIVIPYLATLIGGITSSILFPSTAVLGYLVTGLGDAVAEPVGTRFGKHAYKVPAIRGIRAVRTLEGSAAVFLASALALMMWLALWNGSDLSGGLVGAVVLISLVSTMVEAVSPHGWDNATMQVVPAFLGAILLGDLFP